MALRDWVDAGRQVRHTLGHLRDSDVAALGRAPWSARWLCSAPAVDDGDRAGRGGRRAHCQRRPGTRAQGLPRVPATQQAGRVRRGRRLAELPRGPPRMPLLGRTAGIVDDRPVHSPQTPQVSGPIASAGKPKDGRGTATAGSWDSPGPSDDRPHRQVRSSTARSTREAGTLASAAVTWGCSAIDESLQPVWAFRR